MPVVGGADRALQGPCCRTFGVGERLVEFEGPRIVRATPSGRWRGRFGEVENHTLVGEFDVLETKPRLTSHCEDGGEVPQKAVEVLQPRQRARDARGGLSEGDRSLGRGSERRGGGRG